MDTALGTVKWCHQFDFGGEGIQLLAQWLGGAIPSKNSGDMCTDMLRVGSGFAGVYNPSKRVNIYKITAMGAECSSSPLLHFHYGNGDGGVFP